MQTTRRLTKEDERKFMLEHQREREEQERSLPVDRQHANPAWLAQYWRRVAS